MSLRIVRRATLHLALLAAFAPTVGAQNRQAPSAAPKQPVSLRPAQVGAAKAPAQAPAAATNDLAQELAAVVNGEPITREELARECVKRYGKEVLEGLVNRQLIQRECEKRKLQVSKEELNQELERSAARFSLPVDQWLTMLERERGIKGQQYMNDILWPTLALRKLAADRFEVTAAEIQEVYESEYGPSVKVRLIACKTQEKAQRVHKLAVADPASFGSLARKESDDEASRSSNGMVQPIRKHIGDKQLEQAAFALKEGQVSGVLQIDQQWVFLKCEQHFPARNVPLEAVKQSLSDAIRDTKLRDVAADMFQELQKTASIDVILGDDKKSAAQPTVAATVDGQAISVRALAEACLDRHGLEILEGEIDRRLLEQACKKSQVAVAQLEIDAEIVRAAMAMNFVDKQGRADVAAWLKRLEKEQGLSLKHYVHDTVWPTVALKKLVGSAVQVTQEDVNRGFEANYGPRVRVRAIVLNNHRRAQEVWEMARENPTAEYFAELAEQYSVEPQSRALRGEVPPIQKWGGQPELEKEAFALKVDEISGVVQVTDKFVIMRCEGHTEPEKVTIDEVREFLMADLQEKKLRIEMAKRFDELKAQAKVDNYLAGTSNAPQQRAAGAVAPGKSAAAGPKIAPPRTIKGAVPASGVRK